MLVFRFFAFGLVLVNPLTVFMVTIHRLDTKLRKLRKIKLSMREAYQISARNHAKNTKKEK